MLVRLCTSNHPAATWAGVVEPWLRAHGRDWGAGCAVLAPSPAWIAALKAEAVEAGLPCFGISWYTPGKWRARALRTRPGPPLHVALREDLHLLLELAAARLPDNPLARAYGADPAPFLEVLDSLDGAGWDADKLPDPAARELASAAVILHDEAGWVTSAAADRALRDAAAAGALPLLGRPLLAVGFGPTDWPLRPLLEAAMAAYAEAELVLDVLRDEQLPSAAWIGYWEEKFGGSAEILEDPDAPGPFEPLADAVALRPVLSDRPAAVPSPDAVRPILWLADNLQAEADLVVAQALEFLSESKDTVPARVGIVVGSADSPLAREVAARFSRLGLPHHDSPGYLPGRTGAQALFESWLDWQDDGRLAGWVAWVRAASRHGYLRESSTAIEKVLQAAAQATLSDHPAVLAAWLENAPLDAIATRAFLAEWPRLPESAPGSDFLKALAAVAEKLRWPASPEFLADRPAPWPAAFSSPIPRAAFLRWVRAVTRVPGRTRGLLGREPFAPLQIVDAAGAATQRWTHLVLGGLQHGEWPADETDSPLLNEACLAALNRQALRQGPQGEGHWTVAPGRGLLLPAVERRQLDRAGFTRLLGLPAVGLALTSRRADPADGRPARLSEYFWAAARAMLGRLPTEADWAALAAAGRLRRATFNKETQIISKSVGGVAAPGPAEAARAYAARRDAEQPFDEYSFCLASPPRVPLRLSCKAWEDAVARPGAAWFQHLLRVEPRWDPATEDPAARARGTWAHEWTRPGPAAPAGAPPTSVVLPGLDLWQNDAAQRARIVRAAVTTAFVKAGRPLPESWMENWAVAERAARQFIAALAGRDGWPQALAEAKLPADLRATLPGVAVAIPLTGRLDLLLLPHAATLASGGLAGLDAWLVDFKTGGDEKLSLKKLAEGKGLQLALYALALQALGAGGLALTLLNRDADAEPQLTSADLAEPDLASLWQLLREFALDGRWGERRDVADRFGQAGRYPSATLPVPGEILRKKWSRTHSHFGP